MMRPPPKLLRNQANTCSRAASASRTAPGSLGVGSVEPERCRADMVGFVPMPSMLPRAATGQSPPAEVWNNANLRLEEPEFSTNANSSMEECLLIQVADSERVQDTTAAVARRACAA